MNEYLKAFQDMTQSVEQLLMDEHNSLEIQQSATKLKESVQPCFKELKQSATRLKGLLQVGFDDLDHAEDVWNSKPKIAQASKEEIWEQVGEISGRAFKIPLLGSKCKSDAVKRFQESWNKRTAFLKTKWFTEASGRPKHSISLGDRSGFINDLVGNLNLADEDFNSIIKDSFKLVYQEIVSIQIDIVKHFVNLLDQQSKNSLTPKVNKRVSEINAKFSHPSEYLPGNIKGLPNSVNPALEAFLKQNSWSISSEQFAKFSEEQVSSKVKNIIKAIFDDRIKSGTQALEQAIAFYNYFLERQNRYQQETPEIRQAEKAWIDKQRQQLVQVQRGLEAILSTD
jgi:hypothetical protein